MPRMLRALFPLVLLLSAAPAAAAVWFVGPAGDDANVGDRAAPLRTVGAALARATTGDEIDVAGGTYAEVLSATSLDGISLLGGWSADFAVRDHVAYPTSIVGDGVGFPLSLANCKGWQVDGFTFDANGAWYAVSASADADLATLALALSNCTAKHASAYGIYFRGVQGSVDRCSVVDNGQAGIAAHANYDWVQVALTRSLVARNGSGLYFIGSREFRVFDNVIADNGGWGVWICYPGWPALVYNNTIVNNAGGGIGTGYYKNLHAVNNVVAFNGAPGFNNVQSNYVWGGFNDVYGNAGGDYFNVVPFADDLSVDPGLDASWHLSATSPLLDRGADLSGYLVDDVDGEPRALAAGGDGLFDIGADEIVPVPVSIDVRPGANSPSIVLGKSGTLPVAVYGSATFDATTIDAATVRLAGAAVALRPNGSYSISFSDVNLDGRQDAVLQVRNADVALPLGNARAVLQGRTLSGRAFRGEDAVVVVLK